MSIDSNRIGSILTQEILDDIFPPERSDQFFDALFGDPQEGAYDIRLVLDSIQNRKLNFNFELHQRPGKCLACNLTYGLPNVFARHPIINIKGLVKKIDALLGGVAVCLEWELGKAREVKPQLHMVPLSIGIK